MKWNIYNSLNISPCHKVGCYGVKYNYRGIKRDFGICGKCYGEVGDPIFTTKVNFIRKIIILHRIFNAIKTSKKCKK
ncbi:MAG TPA: hypothetical protein DEO59_00040 [Balneola sp.]|jgi:hypothetical protein|nr:hypothetical protein [Balneola sp.]